MKAFIIGLLKNLAHPGTIIGPGGIEVSPAAYGGGRNIWNMRQQASFLHYGVPRIGASFNRNNRFLSIYLGYSSGEGDLRYRIWEALFVGCRGISFWYEPIFLLPDLRFSPLRQFLIPLIWELREKEGELLNHAEKITNQVAILHSHESFLANYMKQRKADFFKKEMSFAYALEDLGIPYRFIAPEEIGELGKFKALILPESSSLSDKVVSAIRSFAAKGGVVIADYDPASCDDKCVKRSKPALDDLFGIRQKYPFTVKHKMENIQVDTVMGDWITYFRYPVNFVGKGVAPDTAAGISDSGENVFRINSYGKGKTLYLNFDFYEYFELRKYNQESDIREFFRNLFTRHLNFPAFKVVTDNDDIPFAKTKVMRFSDRNAAYAGVLFDKNLNESSSRHIVKIPMLFNGHLYDVLNQKYLGYGNVAEIGIERGYAGLMTEELYKMEMRSVSNIVQCGGTKLRTARCMEMLTVEGQKKAVDTLEKYGIDAPKREFDEERKPLAPPAAPKPKTSESGGGDVLTIDDSIRNLDYKFAKCCNPVMGDEIFGFVTVNAGITIHRVDCPNGMHMQERHPYRVIPARWRTNAASRGFRATIRISVDDVTGILNKITDIITQEMKLNIRMVNMRPDNKENKLIGTIDLEVPHTGALDAVVYKLLGVKGVDKAYRVK